MMNNIGQIRKRRTGEQAQARIIILALVFFLMGVAVSALWFSRKPSANAASQTALSGNTKAPAEQLNSSVVESGVTQPLAHSGNVRPQPQPAPQPDLATLNAVKRLIPNVNSASLEEGTRILRDAAVAEFEQTVQELQARQKRAQQNFIQGQNNQSDAQQHSATKQLQELQAEQLEKLKQIAAKSKAQIETFQHFKKAAR